MSGEIWLRFDIRGGGTVTTEALCQASIEQAAWADRQGIDTVLLGEHHGTDDGYLPSPLVLGAAIAARTNRIRINVMLMLPFHDPLRIAEDLCVLDNVSGGRVDVTTGIGYVPAEFAMFAVDMKQRALLSEEAIHTLRGAFSNKPFQYRGRTVRLTPGPVQKNGPKIFVGGAVNASALRAARMGDGFFPTISIPELLDNYRLECERLGRPIGRIVARASPPISIHVSRDPERDWERVGPSMLNEWNAYSRLTEAGNSIANAITPYKNAATMDSVKALRTSGRYLILTPDECVAYFNLQFSRNLDVFLAPLGGGLSPDIAWESLELLGSEVLPRIRKPPRTG